MDSFAISDSGQVVIQDATSYSAPATSIDGQGAVGGPRIAGPRSNNNVGQIGATLSKSLNALDKLTDGFIKGYVETVEKVNYHEGMTKIVQGQTLQQVKDEDPWYMNIVGPSATVRGAQAMSATTAIQQAETELLGSMQTDREMSPDAYREKLRGIYLQMGNTGDPVVDMLAQSKFAESNASLARTQMKEHLAFQQENTFQLFNNNNLAIGANMAAKRHAAGVTGVAQDEAAQLYAGAVEGFMPLPGMSKDSWQRAGIQTLGIALKKGHFDYYNAIKHSPAWAQLDVKAREMLDEQYDNATTAHAQTSPYVTDLTNSMANFEFNLSRGQTGLGSEAELHGFVDKYNEKYRLTTGSSEPIINNTRRAAILKQWHAGRAHLADKLAAATDKAAAADLQYKRSGEVAMDAFVSGNYSSLRGLDLDGKGVVDAMNANFEREYGSGDPERQMRFMTRAAATAFEDKMRPPRLEQIMRVGLTGLLDSGGNVTPTMQQAYVMAQQMYSTTNGPEALARYIGAENAAKVAGIINSGVSVTDPKSMQDILVRTQRGGSAVADESEKKVVQAFVKSADPGFFRSLVPGADGSLKDFKLTDETKVALGERISGRAAQYARAYSVSVEQAARMVLAEEMRNSDVIGGTVIPRHKNSSTDESLASAVNKLLDGGGNQSTSSYQTAANNVIGNLLREGIKAKGGEVENFNQDDYQVVQAVQMGGGALRMMVMPKDKTKASTAGIESVTLTPELLAKEIQRVEHEATTRKVEDDRNRPKSNVVDTPFGKTLLRKSDPGPILNR